MAEVPGEEALGAVAPGAAAVVVLVDLVVLADLVAAVPAAAEQEEVFKCSF